MLIEIIADMIGGRVKPLDHEDFCDFMNEMMEFKSTDTTLQNLETDVPVNEIPGEFKGGMLS